MLTAYDYSTARVFDDAEIPVLLVGDSAANVVYGYDTTVPVTVDELIPLVRGVVRGAPHALVVADLPFGSYEAGPQQALATATRFMKETGAARGQAGGRRAGRRPDRDADAGGHPGGRPHRLHAAERQRTRRLPRAGPRRRRRADRPRRDRRRRGRRDRRRAGDGARRAGHPDHRQADHPDHRHRRGAELRCPGAGLAGHGRDDQRARPPSSSSASATSATNCAAPQRNTPTRWPPGRSRPRSTPSSSAELGPALAEERGDAFLAVGGVGASGDQPRLSSSICSSRPLAIGRRAAAALTAALELLALEAIWSASSSSLRGAVRRRARPR